MTKRALSRMLWRNGFELKNTLLFKKIHQCLGGAKINKNI